MAAPTPNVVALISGYFGVDGTSVAVIEGQAFRATDAVVKKYPQAFGPAKAEPTVEQATAAPGEKRGA